MITAREKREARLARRLWWVCGVDVFRGVTEHDQAKHRMRAAIIEHSLYALIVVRTPDGEQINFTQAFKATYGEPLIVQTAAVSRENILKAVEAIERENQTETNA